MLVVVDHFTKNAEAYAVPDYTEERVVELLMRNWFARWGCPVAVQSDNGPAFSGEMYKLFLKKNQTIEVHSVAYNPQCNSAVERMNRTLCQLLRTCG